VDLDSASGNPNHGGGTTLLREPAPVGEGNAKEAAGRPADQEPAYVCRDICIAVDGPEGRRSIVEDVNFHVAKGEILSILGPSGTGKTTLLRALSGLVQPTPGSELLYLGSRVQGPPADVILVFQDYASSLLPWRTVEKNVALGLEAQSIGRAERADRVQEALSLVGLANRAKSYPDQLSGGMQQRVQLARALALKPSVLMMDEPFGSLDAITKAQLQDQLQVLQSVTGATIVFVTHDIEEAIYVSDRMLVLTGTPGRMQNTYTVDLPRPRNQLETREHPTFLRLRHEVFQAIGGGARG
jgi:NitT/TauT family transport system ATP-binding protein